jgi:DNA-binding transcriptional LysR family regulator
MEHIGSLSTFARAAETRSFTAAGRILGLSPSAVGKAIARLESELGVRLFHRSTRAITLTAEGSLFLERCSRIFAEIELAKQELGHASDRPQGKLRVSLPQLGMRLMPHLIAFQKTYPDVGLELDFTDRIVNVVEEGFDAVLRIGVVEDSRLLMRKLGGYRHNLVAAPVYFAGKGRPSHPAQLEQHVCLRYRYPSSGKLDPWPLVVDGLPASVDVPNSATANAIDPLLAMAEAGLGIACLPDFAVADAIEQGRLEGILQNYIDDHRSFSVLWPASRQPLPKIRAFVDFITDKLAT